MKNITELRDAIETLARLKENTDEFFIIVNRINNLRKTGAKHPIIEAVRVNFERENNPKIVDNRLFTNFELKYFNQALNYYWDELSNYMIRDAKLELKNITRSTLKIMSESVEKDDYKEGEHQP